VAPFHEAKVYLVLFPKHSEKGKIQV